jgi:hypothetical protein
LAPIVDIKIKSLLKKPARGGIPATANIVKPNEVAKM